MIHELEKIVQNLVVAISSMDVNEYPRATVYRHHMDLTINPLDKIHSLFDFVDMSDSDLRDLFLCSGAEVVTLNESMTGLRINDYNGKGSPVYWINVDTKLRDQAMNDQYNSVNNFMENIAVEERAEQCVVMGDCGNLINWRSVQRHIVNNPRDLVLGCLNHPNRFFTPSPTLYVRMKDAKETEVLPSLDYLAQSDVQSEEPVWFTVGKTVRNTIVL
ncbi:hypothetical protein pEaSNUABM37_00319 [Erwinia phage pEa_SNUABM_37]|nr:hypothetical protein pEaSNUABM37_00319 [Erwinia phage pEa_SNUABM_37]QXO10787.1 hypothetical protein pEaSNUABM48_00319 [Erwinia phage pEa_SNUABM_48]